MALTLIILRTLLLVALLALVGQLAVGMFNWRRRHENVIYQFLAVVARPVVRLARLLTPRLVLDQHVPLVAFLLCLAGYFALGLWHRDVCLGEIEQHQLKPEKVDRSCAKWVQARSQ